LIGTETQNGLNQGGKFRDAPIRQQTQAPVESGSIPQHAAHELDHEGPIAQIQRFARGHLIEQIVSQHARCVDRQQRPHGRASPGRYNPA
jgi:hypothetical protein